MAGSTELSQQRFDLLVDLAGLRDHEDIGVGCLKLLDVSTAADSVPIGRRNVTRNQLNDGLEIGEDQLAKLVAFGKVVHARVEYA